MRQVPAALIAITAFATALAVSCTPGDAATPGPSASCSDTDSWTGNAGDDLWTTAGNWSKNAAPTSTDAVDMPVNTAIGVNLTGSRTICSLNFGASDSLAVAGTLTVTNGVTIVGGQQGNGTSLDTKLVASDIHVEAGLSAGGYSGGNPNTPAVAWTTSTLEVDPGAQFGFGLSGVPNELRATGEVTLGGSGGTAAFDSNLSSESDGNAELIAAGNVQLHGPTTSDGLDLTTSSTSTVDLAGQRWSFTGQAFSKFANGTHVTSSTAGGVLAYGALHHLLAMGAVNIGSGATLELDADGVLSDGRWFSSTGPSPATLTGSGVFLWKAGDISGVVNLASGFVTRAAGTAARHIATPNFGNSALTNSGQFTLSGGTVNVGGQHETFTNKASVKVMGGSFGADCSCTPPIDNASGATWTIAPTGASSQVANGSFRNDGLLVIAPKKTLHVGNTFRQTSTGTTKLTVSSSTTASRITSTTELLNGTAHIVSAVGYAPTQATVTGILKATNRTGAFAHVQSTTRRAGTAWHLHYHQARVDAVLS
jgi:hypothetical protein